MKTILITLMVIAMTMSTSSALAQGKTRLKPVELPPEINHVIRIDRQCLENGHVWLRNDTNNKYMNINLYVNIGGKRWLVGHTNLIAGQTDSVEVDSDYYEMRNYTWSLKINSKIYPVIIK